MINKFNAISIDGIDRSGKGTVFNFLKHLGDYQYALLDRGPISNYAFAKKFGREFNFELSSFANMLFVVLDVNYEDWLVRCKISNEPMIDYNEHRKMYQDAIEDFIGAGCTVLQYNTTDLTPFKIAKDVLNFLKINSTSI